MSLGDVKDSLGTKLETLKGARIRVHWDKFTVSGRRVKNSTHKLAQVHLHIKLRAYLIMKMFHI